MSVVLLGAAALVADVAWMWTNQQRMQRAADAGALAGAIHLPGDEAMAFSTALAETSKNGFTDGVDGINITPRRDPGDPASSSWTSRARSARSSHGCSASTAAPAWLPLTSRSPGQPATSFRCRWAARRTTTASGYLVDAVVSTTTDRVTADSGWQAPPTSAAGAWSNPDRVFSDNASYATETTNGDQQSWRDLGLLDGIPDANTTITGLEVRMNTFINSSASGCQIEVQASWDGGTTWSTKAGHRVALHDHDEHADRGQRDRDGRLGLAHLGPRRLQRCELPPAAGWNCGSTRTVSVDVIDVRVTYVSDVVSTTTSYQPVDVRSPAGGILDPQNFWGALQSQGAPNIQGDAYMTWYDTRTSATNDDHEPDQYYQYAIEFPPGSTTGQVWVFDPGFCEVGTSARDGRDWTIGGANGYSSRQPISTFYRLYDTNNTPYNTGDDTVAGTSGSSFRRLSFSDHVLGQTAADDCSDITWHNDWWQIGTGLRAAARTACTSIRPTRPTRTIS